jgi:hypothetical protein
VKQTLISYTTKPERSGENLRLIRSVFAELQQAAPADLCYRVLHAGNGQFFHFIQTPDGATPFAQSAAFAAFQRDIQERLLVPPQRMEVTIVGSYGMEENEI